MQNKASDTELIAMFNERRETAMETIFHKYYAALCFFANKIVGNNEEAEDVVQEVFVRIFEKRRYKFDSIIALKTFLYNSVKNEAIDHLRKSSRSGNSSRYISLMEAGLLEDATIRYFELESDIISKIFTAIEELPTACRRIFTMSYIEQMSIREICEELNVAESTVKTQRQRAKKQLKERLKELYNFAVYLFL